MKNSGYHNALPLPGSRSPGYIPPLAGAPHRLPRRVDTSLNGTVAMQQRKRIWVRRTVGVLALVALLGGTWAALNLGMLKTRYAAHKFRTATTETERAEWAVALLARGEPGRAKLLGLACQGDRAAATALAQYLDGLPETDASGVAVCGQLLDSFATCPDEGKAAVLELLPAILKRNPSPRCRELVTAGLASPSLSARMAAVRAAMHPRIQMRGDLIPLLSAPEPELRRVAVFAVGPATDGDSVIGDEELSRWLHDPDVEVRKVCYDSLASRGRTEPEIALAWRLTHPEPGERLKLLMDLRYDDDVPDPEPWLERLSRDVEPAVRAGAVRVAVEVATERRLSVPVWVGRIAEVDPDGTVRRVAGFFRNLPTPGAVRQANGP